MLIACAVVYTMGLLDCVDNHPVRGFALFVSAIVLWIGVDSRD